MIVAMTMLALAVAGALLARVFGAARGSVVLVLLLVVGCLGLYKFAESGPTYLFLATFAIPLVVVAAGIGLGAGSALRRKRTGVAKFLLALPVGLLIIVVAMRFAADQSESSAHSFARSVPEVSAHLQVNGKAHLFLVSTTGGPYGLPSRYEYALSDRYILVDANNMFLIPSFSLACITNIPPGKRSPFEDVCKREPSK
jgi:hypothetical protein